MSSSLMRSAGRIVGEVAQIVGDDPHLIRLADYMAGKPATDHSRSPLWPPFARAWIARHSSCAICGCTTSLNVHHIKPFHLFPELELDETNVITLGEKCQTGNHHFIFGHFGDWRKWNPNIVDVAAWLLTNWQTKVTPDYNPTAIVVQKLTLQR